MDNKVRPLYISMPNKEGPKSSEIQAPERSQEPLKAGPHLKSSSVEHKTSPISTESITESEDVNRFSVPAFNNQKTLTVGNKSDKEILVNGKGRVSLAKSADEDIVVIINVEDITDETLKAGKDSSGKYKPNSNGKLNGNLQRNSKEEPTTVTSEKRLNTARKKGIEEKNWKSVFVNPKLWKNTTKDSETPFQLIIKLQGQLPKTNLQLQKVKEFVEDLQFFEKETGCTLDTTELTGDNQELLQYIVGRTISDEDGSAAKQTNSKKEDFEKAYVSLTLCTSEEDINTSESIVKVKRDKNRKVKVYNGSDQRSNSYEWNIAEKFKKDKFSEKILKASKGKVTDKTFLKICVRLNKLDALIQNENVMDFVINQKTKEKKHNANDTCKEVLKYELSLSRYGFLRHILRDYLDLTFVNEVLGEHFMHFIQEVSTNFGNKESRDGKGRFSLLNFFNSVKENATSIKPITGESVPLFNAETLIQMTYAKSFEGNEFLEILSEVTNHFWVEDVKTYLLNLYKETDITEVLEKIEVALKEDNNKCDRWNFKHGKARTNSELQQIMETIAKVLKQDEENKTSVKQDTKEKQMDFNKVMKEIEAVLKQEQEKKKRKSTEDQGRESELKQMNDIETVFKLEQEKENRKLTEDRERERELKQMMKKIEKVLHETLVDTTEDKRLAFYFIVSILFNQFELSIEIWRRLKSPTGAALFAFGLLKAMRKRCESDEQKELLLTYMNNYKQAASDPLDASYSEKPEETINLLGCDMPIWGNVNCIHLALKHGNRTFLTHPACKIFNNRSWYTGTSKTNRKENSKKEIDGTNVREENERVKGKEKQAENERIKGKEKQAENEGFVDRYSEKITEWLSPSILVMFRFISFLIFLFIFAIYLMCLLEAEEFHWVEWLLLVWVATMSAEQINQIVRNRINIIRGPLDLNVFAWLEVISLILFVVAWLFRLIAYFSTSSSSIMSLTRALFSVDFMTFTISSLEICYTVKFLGPLLLMMIRMIKTLIQFMIIVMVICFGYAIASESVLYPQSRLSPFLVFFVMRKAFWGMFGEFNLEELEDRGTSCTDDPAIYNALLQDRCPTKAGRYYVPPLLGVYYIIVNILLFNILIAMLNSRIQPIELKSLEVWQHQTVQLTLKYSQVIFLPPPFTLLSPLLFIFKKSRSSAPFNQVRDNKKRKRLHLLERDNQLDYIRQLESQIVPITEPRCNGRIYCCHGGESEDEKVNALKGSVMTSEISKKAEDILNQNSRPRSSKRYFASRVNSRNGIQWRIVGIKKSKRKAHVFTREVDHSHSLGFEASSAIASELHHLQ